MPTFEIPDGPTTVELPRSGDAKNPAPAQGSATFSVTNRSADSCLGRLSVQVTGSSKAEWFTVDGDRERTFAAGETQTATIKINVPPGVAAGDYAFRLRAVAVNDPDNDHADGPVTTAKLLGSTPITPSKWWIWLLVALAVLAALGVGAWLLLSGDDKPAPGNKIANEIPKPEPAPVPATTAVVPDFANKTVEQAKADAQGFEVIEVVGTPGGKPPRSIVSQAPASGTQLQIGAPVRVTFDPGAVVPPLPNNATFTSATNALRSAHLEPGSFLCDQSSGSAGAQVGRITGFEPGPGTTLASGTKINMRAIQEGRCFRLHIPRERILEMQRMDRVSAVTRFQRREP